MTMFIKVILLIIKNLEKDILLIKMVHVMKEIFVIIHFMDMVHLKNQMEYFMKANG